MNGAMAAVEPGWRAPKNHKEELVRDLPEGVKKRVLRRLGGLESGELAQLYGTCCTEDKCMGDTAAFMVEQWPRFTEEGVGVCASFFKDRFLKRVSNLPGIPLERSHPPHLDEIAVLKGIGEWYRDNGYMVEEGETFEGALPYLFIHDTNECNNGIRARILLDLIDNKSVTLFNHWKEQPDNRLLEVYQHAQRNKKHGDLVILQPLIFVNVARIHQRDCNDDDYLTAFKSYIKELMRFEDSLFTLYQYLNGLPLSEVAKILRGLTGEVPAKALETEKGMLLPYIPGSELPLELLRKLATFGLDDPVVVSPDYLILTENISTWEALDCQMPQLSPACLNPVYHEQFFPHNLVGQRITRRVKSLSQYGHVYKETINSILKVLHVEYDAWCASLPTPEHLTVECFWQLLAFLEREPQYGGLFGELLVQVHGMYLSDYESAESASTELAELIRETVEDSDPERRHQRLCKVASSTVGKQVFSMHSYFSERFELARVQFVEGMFIALKGRFPTLMTLSRDILRVPATLKVPGDLYDLQIDVVAGRLRVFLGAEIAAVVVEELKGSTSEQLLNLYESNEILYCIFKQPQLRKLFNFDNPVEEAGFIVILSEIYHRVFSGPTSIFGLTLRLASTESKAGAWCEVHRSLSDVLLGLEGGQNFEGSIECWLRLERDLYRKLGHDQRIGIVPFLLKSQADVNALDTSVDSDQFSMFAELLNAMAGGDLERVI